MTFAGDDEGRGDESFLPSLSPTYDADKNSWTEADWFLVKNSKENLKLFLRREEGKNKGLFFSPN